MPCLSISHRGSGHIQRIGCSVNDWQYSMARLQGSGAIIVPGIPPYGRSSDLRVFFVLKSAILHTAISIAPDCLAFFTMLVSK